MRETLRKNLKLTGVSLILIAVIFGAGFYLGSTKNFLGTGDNKANASENADLSAFWKVWNVLDEKFVAATTTDQVSSEDRVYGAIKGMVDSLGDPYTVFLPPVENEELAESLQGNFSGVGMEVGLKDGFITVIAPLKNSPAEKAGMLPEDIIAQIDGQSTVNLSLDEAVSLIRGEQGTEVTLSVIREGVEEPIKVTIVRDTIVIPVIDTELRDDGVFVIRLFNFNGESTRAFRQALREFLLARTNKLVLDLRGNPGGYLDAAVDIASWFLPAGKTIVVEDFGDEKEEKVFRSKGFNIFNDNLEMVVLIDGGSASASEIVAGALQAHDLALLVGTNTYGKGSVQELIKITDDTSLKVTIARWLTPDGLSISDGGLKPDHEVKYTIEDRDAGTDPQLEKAAQILLGK